MAKKKTKSKVQKKNKSTSKASSKASSKPAVAKKAEQQPELKAPVSFTDQVASFGKQLQTYKIQHVWPQTIELKGKVQFYGMGGSAIAADLVNNYLRHLGLPDFLSIRKDFYRNHDGINPSPAIFSSYSGMTAETVTQAHHYRGNLAAAITTGGDLMKISQARKWATVKLPDGYQPRAAMGYSFSSLLSLLLAHTAVRPLTSRISADLNAAGKHITMLETEKKFDIKSTNLAEKLKGKAVAVYSSDIISGINYRWRGQLQENADNFAFGGFFPELTHNHINGFSQPEGMKDNLAVVILKWITDPILVKEKQNKMAAMLRDKGFTVVEISTQNASLMASMMELVYLADCVSMKLAELNGVNPEQIELIQSLKK